MVKLGAFSISLSVKNLHASLDFYAKLGFDVIDGDSETWVILENGAAKIGLFQGMFEENILTFHPDDVRSIQRTLKERGLALQTEAEEDGDGPTSCVLLDPDGNPILIDQH